MIPPILEKTQVADNLTELLTNLHKLDLTARQYNEIAKIVINLVTQHQILNVCMSNCIQYVENTMTAVLDVSDSEYISSLLVTLNAIVSANAVHETEVVKTLPKDFKKIHRKTYKQQQEEIKDFGTRFYIEVSLYNNREYPRLPVPKKQFSLN